MQNRGRKCLNTAGGTNGSLFLVWTHPAIVGAFPRVAQRCTEEESNHRASQSNQRLQNRADEGSCLRRRNKASLLSVRPEGSQPTLKHSQQDCKA